MQSIQSLLGTRFADAFTKAFGPDFKSADPQIKPSNNAQFGDFQANAAMGLASRLGKNPRAIAQELVSHLDLSGLAQKPEIAGPGFINIKLDEAFLSNQLTAFIADPYSGIEASHNQEGLVVLDYSSPNVAKEMHVGHLRSTIIGDAIARILSATGSQVLRQNHLGDWGTQFGMLIEHITDLGWHTNGAHSISDLNQLYKEAKAKFDADPAFAERARSRVVLLQAGDEQTIKLWQFLIEESKKHFASVYATLGVLLDEGDYCGDSFYNPWLAPTVEELKKAGKAVESNGAMCVFPEGFTTKDGTPSPLILQKSDGGYGYDTTDMAAIRYRIREKKARRIIIVTDARQRQHFAMIFKAAAEAGWIPEGVVAEHVFFGSVNGDDGKPFKSRSGETIKLSDLLDEAVARAFAVVSSKNPELPEDERKNVARIVGIGAVKYADLSNDKVKDYVFSWDRMLAFDGNTAPYLQNAYVRIQSIFRKAKDHGVVFPEFATPTNASVQISESAERMLALKLLQFPETLTLVSKTLEPHRLCTWLYELASLYHQFYEHCPVLSAPTPSIRDSRLLLSAQVARFLEKGLNLLGIEVVPRM